MSRTKHKRKWRWSIDHLGRHFKARAKFNGIDYIRPEKRVYASTQIKPGETIPGTLYTYVREKSLEGLEGFKDHRRLKVFYHKGTKCVHPDCVCTGTRLIAGRDIRGNIHWDVYTNDFVMLTVDHIVPRAKGGGEELENKQPMCRYHNERKADKMPEV